MTPTFDDLRNAVWDLQQTPFDLDRCVVVSEVITGSSSVPPEHQLYLKGHNLVCGSYIHEGQMVWAVGHKCRCDTCEHYSRDRLRRNLRVGPQCPDCEGTGKDWCTHCGGTLETPSGCECWSCDDNGEDKCLQCNGTGELDG